MPKKKSYHHGELRAALLEATGQIIREKGIGFVSLREVARRLDVSHAAPAHHFPSKSALLTAFATQGYHRLAEAVLAELEKHPMDPGRRLQAVGEGYVRFAIANPEHFSMMFHLSVLDENDIDFQAASDAAYGMLMFVVAECVEAGLVKTDEAEAVAIAAWSLVHGFANLWIGGRLADRVQERNPMRMATALSSLFSERVLRRD